MTNESKNNKQIQELGGKVSDSTDQLQGVPITGPEGAIEIAPGMTTEEMRASFFDGALIEPNYKVFQLNSKGHRYYYRFDAEGNPTFYPSVTTILSQTLPQSEFLLDWIIKMGKDKAEAYKMERAAYGTFMHAIFERLVIDGEYCLDELRNDLVEYIEFKKLTSDFVHHAEELKKDILAFAQWLVDYDVKPLAVEIALTHSRGYAGMIDLVCTMNETPNSDNRITAIVDFKSGRKGFYKESELQLHMYKDMWNENFDSMPVERVFNFSPKEWRKRPGYNFKEQTNSKEAAKIPFVLELAAIEDAKKDNSFTSTSGNINLHESRDLSSNILTLTLSELVKSKTPKDKTPDSDVDATKQEDKVEDKPKKQPRKTVANAKSTTARKTTATRKTATPRKTAKSASTAKTKATTRKTVKKPVSVKETPKKTPSNDSASSYDDLLNDKSNF